MPSDPSDIANAGAEWFEVDTQVNATATATRPGETGKQHYISGFTISFSAAPASAVSALVSSGVATRDRIELPAAVQAPIIVNFPRAWTCGAGEAASLSLPALGPGVRGTVTLRGFTRYA